MARPQFVPVLEGSTEPLGYPLVCGKPGPCSFCHKAATSELRVLAGVDRDVRICSECITVCLEILSENPKPESWSPPSREGKAKGRALACSFCDAEQGEVYKLIAGPSVYVCDGCVSEAGAFLKEG